MTHRDHEVLGRLAAAMLLVLVATAPARAIIPVVVATSSSGDATLGIVSKPTIDSGGPIFSGSLMLSPGQGYPTADFGNSSIVAGSSQPSPLPFFVAAGPIPVPLGTPGLGSFGGGAALVTQSGFGFALNDTNAGGSESYVIARSTTTYLLTSNFGGSIGASFGIAGSVPTAGSAADIGLVLTVTDNTAGSPILGTNTFTILLGDQNTGAGFNPVASAQFTSFTQTGSSFEAAGADIIGSGLARGDTFTVTSTLVGYADPASLEVIDITNFPGLAADLPTFSVISGIAGVTTVPEPASVVLLGGGIAGMIGFPAARRWRRMRCA